jgi:hypothetical protein
LESRCRDDVQKFHERAAMVTRDGFWTRLYVRGLDPDEAAKAAAREYDATHRPPMAMSDEPSAAAVAS